MLLHASDTLFTWAEVNQAEFGNLPLRAAPAILLEGISSLEEHYANMAVIFKAEPIADYFRFSQNRTPALSHANATPPPL
jgi:hypothetical protein